jgi:hypothetical protein
MAQLTPEEFEALWQEAHKSPTIRAVAPAHPIQLDMSLSAILDRYGTIADGFLAEHKISKIQHDALMAAIAALKTALAAINEKDLVAQHFADAGRMVQQQVQARIAAFVAGQKP